MSAIVGWNFAARRKNDEDGKKYHTDIQCRASEDERHWIPPERLQLSAVGFYRYISPLRLSKGVSTLFACADGPGSVFILAASLPQKSGTKEPGFYPMQGSLASNRTSGEVGAFGIVVNCVLIAVLFLPVSLHLSN